MALSIEERLAKARQNLAAVKAEAAKAKAREKLKLSQAQRRLDNRRKFLLGAYTLDAMERDATERQRVLSGLEKFLTRSADRAAFDLEPLQS